MSLTPETIAEAVRKHVAIEAGRAAGDNENFRRWLGKHELGESALQILVEFYGYLHRKPDCVTTDKDGNPYCEWHPYYGLILGIYVQRSGGLLFCRDEQIPDIFNYMEDLTLTITA